MTDMYSNYYNIYGNIESQEEFERLLDEAVLYMDKITYGQSSNALEDENVIKCSLAICNLLYNFNAAEEASAGVESETVDGYSVRYTSKATARAELDFEIVRTCHLYLPGKMLYRGV